MYHFKLSIICVLFQNCIICVSFQIVKIFAYPLNAQPQNLQYLINSKADEIVFRKNATVACAKNLSPMRNANIALVEEIQL